MVSHGGLSDNKSQVSRTLHSILTDLNHAAFWIVSSRPLISKSSILIIIYLKICNCLQIIGIE